MLLVSGFWWVVKRGKFGQGLPFDDSAELPGRRPMLVKAPPAGAMASTSCVLHFSPLVSAVPHPAFRVALARHCAMTGALWDGSVTNLGRRCDQIGASGDTVWEQDFYAPDEAGQKQPWRGLSVTLCHGDRNATETIAGILAEANAVGVRQLRPETTTTTTKYIISDQFSRTS